MLNPVALVILDGWGYRNESFGNAILQACTPQMDALSRDFNCCLIEAAGEAVGLPPGQMGNSEVGHLNLGAGRIVFQDFSRISRAIEDGTFFENPVLREAMHRVHRSGGNIHLIGLLSDGGVHSHTDHLAALLEMAEQQQAGPVFIHAILDGRIRRQPALAPTWSASISAACSARTVLSPPSAGATTPWIGTGAGIAQRSLSCLCLR